MKLKPIERRVLLIIDACDGHDRRILSGIGHYARATSTWDFRRQAPGEIDRIRKLIDTWKPTGIISRFKKSASSAPSARESDLFRHLIDTGIPMVELDALDSHTRIPLVYTDTRAVVQLVFDHMIQLGIRSFGYVGKSSPLDRQRIEIFAELAHQKDCVFESFDGEIRDENDPAGKFGHWLRHRPRHTGLLTSSDWVGWHVIAACLNAGFRVPDDFAVMGIHDDQPCTELAPVPLTSVAVAAEQIGHSAAGLMDRMMRGLKVSLDPIILPPVGIVARRSTDIVAAEDPDIAQVLRYIHKHAAEGCTMKDVLRKVPADRRRVERWFDRNLGRSPFKEIQRIRITHVKKLLAETDESMAQVAGRCGFPTANLLSRTFRREAGMTLRQYRRQFRQTAQIVNSS